MSDAVREKNVQESITYWQRHLWLDNWDIRYNPNRKVAQRQLANSSHMDSMLICEIGIQQGCPDEEVDGCVLHELLHIVVAPLADKAHALAGTLGNEAVSIMVLDECHELTECLVESLARVLMQRRTMPFGRAMRKQFSSFIRDAA